MIIFKSIKLFFKNLLGKDSKGSILFCEQTQQVISAKEKARRLKYIDAVMDGQLISIQRSSKIKTKQTK